MKDSEFKFQNGLDFLKLKRNKSKEAIQNAWSAIVYTADFARSLHQSQKQIEKYEKPVVHPDFGYQNKLVQKESIGGRKQSLIQQSFNLLDKDAVVPLCGPNILVQSSKQTTTQNDDDSNFEQAVITAQSNLMDFKGLSFIKSEFHDGVMQGYLKKHVQQIKLFQKSRYNKRYFIIDFDFGHVQILKSKEEKDPKEIKNIPFRNITGCNKPTSDLEKFYVGRSGGKYKFPFFVITIGRTYELLAVSEEERKMWIFGFGYIVAKNRLQSQLFQKQVVSTKSTETSSNQKRQFVKIKDKLQKMKKLPPKPEQKLKAADPYENQNKQLQESISYKNIRGSKSSKDYFHISMESENFRQKDSSRDLKIKTIIKPKSIKKLKIKEICFEKKPINNTISQTPKTQAKKEKILNLIKSQKNSKIKIKIIRQPSIENLRSRNETPVNKLCTPDILNQRSNSYLKFKINLDEMPTKIKIKKNAQGDQSFFDSIKSARQQNSAQKTRGTSVEKFKILNQTEQLIVEDL